MSVKSFPIQANNRNINDMFSGTGSYPLENLSKENRWVKLADALVWKHIEAEYNKRLSNQSRVVRATSLPAWSASSSLMCVR